MSSHTLIDAREKGAFEISIATSLALEAAAGIYPDRPENPAPITKGVREVWINLRTLVRNLYGAMSTDRREMMLPNHGVGPLVEEMTIIENVIIKISNGNVRTVFYVCDYTSVQRKFPKALLRQPKTPKQIVQQKVEDETIHMTLATSPPHDIRFFNFELNGSFPHSFIISHLPIDLLSRYSFQRLELLESHSGRLKAYPMWYTKLTNGKELDNIPFCRFSIQVFGDGGNLFGMLPNKTRAKVLELAKEDRWSPLTTDEKIRLSLRKVEDPQERALLQSFL